MPLPDLKGLTQLIVGLSRITRTEDMLTFIFYLQFPFPEFAKAIRVSSIINLLEMLKSGPEFFWVEHTSLCRYGGCSYLIMIVKRVLIIFFEVSSSMRICYASQKFKHVHAEADALAVI